MVWKMINQLQFVQPLPRVGVEKFMLSIVRQSPVEVPVVIVTSSAPTTLFTVANDRLLIEISLPSEFEIALTDHEVFK